MISEDDFLDAPEDYSGPSYETDGYFSQAQADIRALYEQNKESVFYIRQLQVKFEKKYFHWITNNAIIGLLKLGYLKDFRFSKEKGTSTRFFIHYSNRYAQRQINKLEKIIEEYSQDHITRSCGHRAEDLFCNALAMKGFMPVAKKVREYKGKKWEKTGHDLDFIFSKDNIGYGCEIKNTMGYIDKEELEIKLEMCSFLGVKPLFILRWAPKTYIHMINNKGGYALLFETQIYELSQEQLAKRMQEVLEMPVICSKAIPDGMIVRFDTWHSKNM
ncbi:MAG: hypothetical protein V1701_01900 [Planctomycetota bacterium]